MQTEKLKACCPLPKSTDDYKKDPECGHHLEGIEGMKEKEMFHAGVCFVECMFKSRELIGEDKEVMWEEIKKRGNEVFGESEDFKDVTEKSIEFCETKCEIKYSKTALN